MKLSDACYTAQIVLFNEIVADFVAPDEDEGTVSIRVDEHDEPCIFADVEIDLSERNSVELVPIERPSHIDEGETVWLEFYMLRPMTVDDFNEAYPA